MEEIIQIGVIEGIVLILAITFAIYTLLFIAPYIALEILKVARWKINYDILGRGKCPENPIKKLSIVYQTDFFTPREKLSNGVVKLEGIESLTMKSCMNEIFVLFNENMYSSIELNRRYERCNNTMRLMFWP